MPRNYVNRQKIDMEFYCLNNKEQNKAKYQELSNSMFSDISRQAKMSFPPTYRLIRVEISDDAFQLALLSDSTAEVVYYIKCIIISDIFLNAKPITQVLLWRTSVVSHRKVTSGVAEEVFRNYLLEHYNIVASDNSHTLEGRDFWVRQLGYALEYDEYVYRFNVITCELAEITDHAVIRDNSCDLWGDSEDYENILALISKDSLPKPQYSQVAK